VYLIEAPGPHYLGVKSVNNVTEFHWTPSAEYAIAFVREKQARLVLAALRLLCPRLFEFAVVLREPKVVSHTPREEAPAGVDLGDVPEPPKSSVG